MTDTKPFFSVNKTPLLSIPKAIEHQSYWECSECHNRYSSEDGILEHLCLAHGISCHKGANP